MAGITLEQAEAKLAAVLLAYDKVLTGQAWSHNGRAVTRADLGKLQDAINFWEAKVKSLDRGGIRTRRGVLAE